MRNMICLSLNITKDQAKAIVSVAMRGNYKFKPTTVGSHYVSFHDEPRLKDGERLATVTVSGTNEVVITAIVSSKDC